MKKRLSHFAYNERSRSSWTLTIPHFTPLSPIRSTIKTVTYVPGTFVTLVSGPHRGPHLGTGQRHAHSRSASATVSRAAVVSDHAARSAMPARAAPDVAGAVLDRPVPDPGGSYLPPRAHGRLPNRGRQALARLSSRPRAGAGRAQFSTRPGVDLGLRTRPRGRSTPSRRAVHARGVSAAHRLGAQHDARCNCVCAPR